jgi:hypothetical protein
MLLLNNIAYSYSETMQRFLSADWVLPETKEAVVILKKTVTDTEAKLPIDLQKKLRNSLAERLSRLSAEIDRYSDKRYKSAYTGTRIIELIVKVTEIQYRKIDRNIEKRRQASKQYAELFSAFKEYLEEENTSYSTNISVDLLDNLFTNIQNNILESGYGNPLNQDEFRDLKQILDKTASQLLPFVKKTDDTQQQIENRQKANRIVMEGVRNCRTFLQKRDFIDSFVSSKEARIALYMKNETLRKKFIKELTGELVFKPIVDQTNKKINELYSQRFGSLSESLPINGSGLSDMGKKRDSEQISTDTGLMDNESDNLIEFIEQQIRKTCNDSELQHSLLQQVQLLRKSFENHQLSPQLIRETKFLWKQGIEYLPKQNNHFDDADCVLGLIWQTYHAMLSERQPLSDFEKEEKILQLQQLLQVLDGIIPAMNRQNKLSDKMIQVITNEVNRCKMRLNTYCGSPFYPLLYYPLPKESFDNTMKKIQKQLDEEIENFWKNIDQYTQSLRDDAVRQAKSGNKTRIDFFQNKTNVHMLLQSQTLVALTMGNIVRHYGLLNRKLNYKNTEFFPLPNTKGIGLSYRMQEGLNIRLTLKESE